MCRNGLDVSLGAQNASPQQTQHYLDRYKIEVRQFISPYRVLGDAGLGKQAREGMHHCQPVKHLVSGKKGPVISAEIVERGALFQPHQNEESTVVA